MLDIQLVAEDASWRERLFSMLGSEDGRLDPYIRLWREGQLLCGSDSDIKGLPAHHVDVARRDGQYYSSR